MKKIKTKKSPIYTKLNTLVISVVASAAFAVYLISLPVTAGATCSTTGTTYGTDTMTVSVPSTTTYNLWLDVESPSPNAQSFQVTLNGVCYTVGTSSLSANTLGWTDMDNTPTAIQQSLTKGTNYTLSITGLQQGAAVMNNIDLLASNSCTPTGDGTNCTTNQPTPSTPTVTAKASGTSSVNLSWTASTETGATVEGYYIYRSTTSTMPTSPLATVTASTLSYTDSTVTAGQNYYYWVVAYDNQNPANTSSAGQATVSTQASPPATPSLSAADINAVSIGLTWSPVSDTGGSVGSYKLYRGTSPNGTLIDTVSNTGQTKFSYPDSGLSPNTKYSYYVIAYDTNNNASNPGSASATTSSYPTPTPPGTPTLTDVSATSVLIKWTAGSDPLPGPGLEGYDVYRNGNLIEGISGTTTLSYTDNNATPNATNTYCVDDYDSATPADVSSQTCQSIVTPNYPPPTAPSNVTSSEVAQTSATISWSASTTSPGGPALGGYIISRTGGLNGTFTTTVGPTTLKYPDSGLTPNTSYQYTVQAFDTANNYSPVSSPVLTVQTLNYTAPNSPTNVQSSYVTTDSATISWTAPSQSTGGLPVAGYYLILNGTTVQQLAGASTTQVNLTNLTSNTSYTYQVETYDSANDTSPPVSVSFTTQQGQKNVPPTAPQNVVASAVSSSQINLTWSASTDATGTVAGYYIYRSTSATTGFTQVGTSTTTSYGDANLSANTTYYYEVIAYNNTSQQSAPSSIVNATTQQVVSSQYATITGTVTDSTTNNPISGAKITTGTNASATGTEITSTNSQGQYTLTDILATPKHVDNHSLRFSSKKYNSIYVTLATPQPITYTKDVSLVPTSVYNQSKHN